MENGKKKIQKKEKRKENAKVFFFLPLRASPPYWRVTAILLFISRHLYHRVQYSAVKSYYLNVNQIGQLIKRYMYRNTV